MTRRWWSVVALVALAGCAMDVSAVEAPIVNGRAATDAERYGTVAIPIGGIVEPLDNCTGTLIRPNVVLTAAHCFFTEEGTREDDSRYRVVAGPGRVFDATSEQTYGVSRVAVHPGYSAAALDSDLGPAVNDIALIVTDRDVSQVSVIPLLSVEEANELAEGVRVTISGYGASRLDGAGEPELPGELLITEVTVQALSETELLASDPGGSDTCPGDSGGPVYLFLGGQPRVVGVTSRADPTVTSFCGEGGIYTLPDSFRAWIDMEVGAPGEGGGGCSVTASSARSGALPLGFVLIGLLLVARRRR